jgi:hypothetical protein
VADRRFRELRERLGEWFLRKQALQAARAQLPRPDEQAGRAFEQARLLREVTRQLAEPAEELPPGRRPAVLLSLYRDLVYWTLVAERKGQAEAAPDLTALWQQQPADRLLRAAGSPENLDALRGALVGLSPAAALDATDEDAARVREFADVLYRDLEVPRRRVDRILIRRWLHLAAAAAVLLAIVVGIRSIAMGPNLVAGGHFRTSSTWPDCAHDDGCAAQMFHTRQEDSPWVEFDLGGVKTIHRIDVRNRVDCCQDRAVPLIAEISSDRAHWREVGRRDTEFSNWTATFPASPARYVRLRVPKLTMFHLKNVAIR